MGIKNQNSGTRPQIQHILDGDVLFLTGPLAIDISTKVISNFIHPDPAQANNHPKIKIARNFPSSAAQRYLDTFFSFNTLRTSDQSNQQKKQRLEGIGSHQLGTEKGDSTDDIIKH